MLALHLAGFRLNAGPETTVRLFRHGEPVVADAAQESSDRAALITPDDHIVVFEAGEAFVFSRIPPSDEAEDAAGDGAVWIEPAVWITQATADRIGQLRYVNCRESLLAKHLHVTREIVGCHAQAPRVDRVLGDPMVDKDQSTGDVAAPERQAAAPDKVAHAAHFALTARATMSA